MEVTVTPPNRKKLIEVALPLEAINTESAREKSIRYGHPSTLHLWWARRPLATCRAVLFASLVDDPGEYIADEAKAKKERARLFAIIERLVKWENINDATVLNDARREIASSVARVEGEDLSKTATPAQIQAFLDKHAPPVLDPFCGGGSIPLEAQRLGLKTYASDLNPVAVLITKALVEIPPKFADRPPVNPEARKQANVLKGGWRGTRGLVDDVRYYGQRMLDEAQKRVGYLYPKIKVTADMATERTDLKIHIGRELTVIAWLWARTIRCPNPACGADMPLVRSFALCTRKGKEAAIRAVARKDTKEVRFEISTGSDEPPEGTVGRRGATCLVCANPVQLEYARAESRAGRMSYRLMAIVAEGQRGRVYLPPSSQHVKTADVAKPSYKPDAAIPDNPGHTNVYRYGLTTWGDLFTPRQLVALTTFSDLVLETTKRVRLDAVAAKLPDDGLGIEEGGTGALAYAEAVGTYLALAVGRLANRASTICIWNTGGEKVEQTFTRQAIPMTWDFAEANVFSDSTGSWPGSLEWIPRVLEALPLAIGREIRVNQLDACKLESVTKCLPFTDPPYYDNIGYADLSDFFYVWLRRSLSRAYPDLFSTLLTPKAQELVATPYRFGGDSDKAKRFFEEGLGKAFSRIQESQDTRYPFVVYYAFKQSESTGGGDGDGGPAGFSSTGWETMLEGVAKAGFAITGTWPLRTERDQGIKTGSNVLASSIAIVCRQRLSSAPMATRREYAAALRSELPVALRKLQQGSVAPVDMAQASIGPGMAIFGRYQRVLEADGSPMSVRTALQLINSELESFLRQEESEADKDTQFCIAWFEQYGMTPGPFGEADVLARAKNTSIEGMVRAGILQGKGGKVAVLSRADYPSRWDPAADSRLTLWECTQHLIKQHQERGETAASALMARLGPGRSEDAKTLAYRLYTICERKGWTEEALAYNEFVIAWPENLKKAAALVGKGPQKTLDAEETV